ncbi:SpaA isopeptide-forming pilin-related protein [Anaerovorax odorimutans]|uniref:SpaA isopeptide-forming pilin-related protein n=1 Tax=Anaerovorax odorimutans TaxID=109327 RepID=A0ABT1RN70_9FIRM|nr:SpaA isopeptide-forming pilin-related protein [Anaerovorax odorimutans]MCQ4636635.1 SpaA isopeptide-forming pilin-related protein [Anaerovorax odorimutans]
MKKGKRILAIILSVLIAGAAFNSGAIAASAEGGTGYDVKNLVNKIVIYKDGKLVEGGASVAFNDELKVRYYFDALYPHDMGNVKQNFETGVVYDLPGIPEKLMPYEGAKLEFEAKLQDGETVLGQATFTPEEGKDGSVTIKFDDGLKNHDEIKNVWLEFGVKLDKDKCGDGQGTDLNFEVNGATTTIHLTLADNVPTPAGMEKTGTYDDKTNLISWNIKVTEGSQEYEGDLRIDDVISDNQEYVADSFKVKEPKATSPQTKPLTVEKNQFSYVFKPTKTKGAVWEFSYQTALKPTAIVKDNQVTNGEITVSAQNTAKLVDVTNEDKITEDTKNVDCKKTYTWLSKEGQVTDAKNGEVTWTLKVNANGYKFNNVTVYDKVIGTPVNTPTSDIYWGTGNAVSGSGSHTKGVFAFADADIATKTKTEDEQTYSMKVDLGTISGNEDIVITYVTYVSNYDEYIKYNQPNVSNEAWMSFDWPDYDGPGVDRRVGVPTLNKGLPIAQAVISKSNGTYNESTHEITWEVTVNKNKAALDNAQVVDILGAHGNDTTGDNSQTYVSYSNLKIGGTAVKDEIPNFVDKSEPGKVKFNFGDRLNGKTATFTLTTKLADPNYYEANTTATGAKTFYNKVELYDGEDYLDYDDGNVTPTNTVLQKEDPTYDYASKTLSWRIEVNHDKMALAGPVVSDRIAQGLLLEKDTIRFADKTPIPAGEDGDAKPYYTYSSGELRVYLEDFKTGDEAKTICFDTKIDVENAVFDGKAFKSYNGDIPVSNQATLTKTSSSNPVSDSGNTNIKNQFLDKTGKIDTTAGLRIDYNVVINQPGISLPKDTYVTDILSPGLALNLPSIELREAEVLSDGTVKPKEDSIPFSYETEILQEGNTYKKEAGSYLLKIHLDNPGTKTYVLTYNAAVSDTNKESYSNEISMTGMDPESKDTSVQMSQGELVGSGGGTVSNASRVEITKLDVDHKDEKLKGAVFALLYDDHLIEKKTTDNDGKVSFSGMEPNFEYTIREIEPAAGYKGKLISVEKAAGQGKEDVTLGSDQQSFSFTAPSPGYTTRLQFYAYNEKYKIQFKKAGLIHETCSNPALNAPDGKETKLLAGARFTFYELDEQGKRTGNSKAFDSNEDGIVTAEGIGWGQYEIEETKAPAGYLQDKTIYYAKVEPTGTSGLTKKDGTPVANNAWINDVPRTDIILHKVNEKNTNEPVAGSTYGLYKEVKAEQSAKKSKAAKAQEQSSQLQLVATAVTDKDGLIKFEGVLMDTNYIIRELKAPDGSYVSKNPITIQFKTDAQGKVSVSSYDDGDGTTVIDPATGEIVWKEPPVEVEFYKKDESGKLLAGAHLQVEDKDGNVVEKWISDGKAPHLISGLLTADTQYYLVETEAPKGYRIAKKVPFTVKAVEVGPGENRIIKVEMTNLKETAKGGKSEKGGSKGDASSVETGDPSMEKGLWKVLLAAALSLAAMALLTAGYFRKRKSVRDKR